MSECKCGALVERVPHVPGCPAFKNVRPGFFPNGQCRHFQLVDGWAKVWCIRTEDGHAQHETANGHLWSPEGGISA